MSHQLSFLSNARQSPLENVICGEWPSVGFSPSRAQGSYSWGTFWQRRFYSCQVSINYDNNLHISTILQFFSSSSDEDRRERPKLDIPPEYWHIQKLVKYMKTGNQTATVVALCCLKDHDLTTHINQLAIQVVVQWLYSYKVFSALCFSFYFSLSIVANISYSYTYLSKRIWYIFFAPYTTIHFFVNDRYNYLHTYNADLYVWYISKLYITIPLKDAFICLENAGLNNVPFRRLLRWGNKKKLLRAGSGL